LIVADTLWLHEDEFLRIGSREAVWRVFNTGIIMPANFGSHRGHSMFRRSLLPGASAVALGLLLVPVGTVSEAQAQNTCGLYDGDGLVFDAAATASQSATGVLSLACGEGAIADNQGTAVGQGSRAGDQATAVGQLAKATGRYTTALGADAGFASIDGDFNTWVGGRAGLIANGQYNTAIGFAAGQQVTGDENFAGGILAGVGVTGNQNTAIGYSAGQGVSGNNNFAGGVNAGFGVGDPNTNANDNVAIGTNAGSNHLFSDTVAIGRDTVVGSDGAIAIGLGASALNSIAIGVGATADNDGTAVGDASTATGQDSAALGIGATATGDYSTAVGGDAEASGFNSSAFGNASTASGDDSVALGADSEASGEFSTAVGQAATASGDFSTAVGSAAQASGFNSTAIGDSSAATGDNSTAIGADSEASAAFSTAVGQGTVVQHAGGVAIGVDSGGTAAETTLENQFVLGTVNHTYTAPGITSDLSRARQSGPVEVVTSDAHGNLATDQGFIFDTLDDHAFQLARHDRRLNEHTSGIALAMSMQNPDLVGAERFGLAGSWGTFEGAHALSFSVMGVIAHDVFHPGDRIAVSGGFGAGFAHKSGGTVYGGRAGLQWTW
jgi:trimeric autotransporter adhesin